MKTLFKKISIVLIVLASGMSSCSKSDDSPPPPTTAELLAHKWFIVKQEDSSTTPPTVIVADACAQTGYYNFLTDGSMVAEGFHYDMSSNCVSNGADVFTYALTANEEQIIVTDNMSSSSTLTIVELTETDFVFTIGTIKGFFHR
ncbi:MAG: lipocalin family protein [Gelidibacter sp.]